MQTKEVYSITIIFLLSFLDVINLFHKDYLKKNGKTGKHSNIQNSREKDDYYIKDIEQIIFDRINSRFILKLTELLLTYLFTGNYCKKTYLIYEHITFRLEERLSLKAISFTVIENFLSQIFKIRCFLVVEKDYNLLNMVNNSRQNYEQKIKRYK